MDLEEIMKMFGICICQFQNSIMVTRKSTFVLFIMLFNNSCLFSLYRSSFLPDEVTAKVRILDLALMKSGEKNERYWIRKKDKSILKNMRVRSDDYNRYASYWDLATKTLKRFRRAKYRSVKWPNLNTAQQRIINFGLLDEMKPRIVLFSQKIFDSRLALANQFNLTEVCDEYGILLGELDMLIAECDV